jgi:hypothetical protein
MILYQNPGRLTFDKFQDREARNEETRVENVVFGWWKKGASTEKKAESFHDTLHECLKIETLIRLV